MAKWRQQPDHCAFSSQLWSWMTRSKSHLFTYLFIYLLIYFWLTTTHVCHIAISVDEESRHSSASLLGFNRGAAATDKGCTGEGLLPISHSVFTPGFEYFSGCSQRACIPCWMLFAGCCHVASLRGQLITW